MMRGRDIHEAHRAATPLELLFDLTFVAAIAQAAAQLHHGEVEHQLLHTLPAYLIAFFAIWWAWMNYTWFASAYDNDDTLFRVLTMVQMGGVLLFATGVQGLFAGQFTASVAGYVVMRVALCVQWLRAAKGDALRRHTCRRYALGIALAQVAWVAFMLAVNGGWLKGVALWMVLAVLAGMEMLIPLWAESAGKTPWHAHHIAERYAGMVIIVLGECVLGATNSIANMWQAHGWSVDLMLVGFAGTLLVFCLWWMYFLLPSGDALHQHRNRAWGWGYGHAVVFAALAAVGAGLGVVADVLKSAKDVALAHGAAAEGVAQGLSPLFAISTVAVPQAVFAVALWAVYRHATRIQAGQLPLTLVCLGCIALAPIAVAHGLPLPWGLLLLSLGPLVAIAYNEHGRRHCRDQFAVR